MNEVLLKLYLNAAHCFLELAEVKKVLTYARKVLVDTLCFCQKIWRKTYAHLIYLMMTKWFKAKHPLKGLKNYRAVAGDVLLLLVSWLRLICSFLCDWRKTFYKENCFVFSVKSWSSIPLSWLFFQVITAVDALEIYFKIVFDC